MNELKALIRERNKLDARIAELRHAMVECGRAQLSYDQFTGRWRVMYNPKVLQPDFPKNVARVSLALGPDKKKLIEEIPMVIADLQGLYDNCKGMSDEDESKEDPTD